MKSVGMIYTSLLLVSKLPQFIFILGLKKNFASKFIQCNGYIFIFRIHCKGSNFPILNKITAVFAQNLLKVRIKDLKKVNSSGVGQHSKLRPRDPPYNDQHYPATGQGLIYRSSPTFPPRHFKVIFCFNPLSGSNDSFWNT